MPAEASLPCLPNGPTFVIRRGKNGRWLLGGDMIGPVPRDYDTKQEAIFSAEFTGRRFPKVTLNVVDPDEELYPAPDYWQGDMIECP